jgi:Predicted flavoprotein involved in K+ transport
MAGRGFAPILGGYMDNLVDWDANRALYDFWARKTRARIHDKGLKDILAPLQPFHPIGAKRSSFELDYYEQFNKPNVSLVNLREHNIAAIEPSGIRTSDGFFYPVDVIAVATGFDGLTGSMTRIDGLRNTEGIPLEHEWKDGVHTYLGMTITGYPNMFFTLGPHAPSALSNGPSSIEIQGRWIVDTIQKIVSSGLSYIEPTTEAEAT